MSTSTPLDPSPFTTGLDDRPRCECAHPGPDGPEPCGATATFSVTLICAEVGCDAAAAVYLACARCLREWQVEGAADPTLPRMRIRRL